MEYKSKTIDGDSYEISQPYAEGHVLTAIEARVLNQTRAENVGNNARAKLKEMKEGGASLEAMQAFIGELDSNYVFTASGARAAAKLDPYEKEAQKKARELLRAHLAETGRKLTVAPDGFTDEEWEEKIEAEVERIAALPEIIKAAKQDVDNRKKRADAMKEAIGTVNV